MALPRGTLKGIDQQLEIIADDLGDLRCPPDLRLALAAVLARVDRLREHLAALQKVQKNHGFKPKKVAR